MAPTMPPGAAATDYPVTLTPHGARRKNMASPTSAASASRRRWRGWRDWFGSERCCAVGALVCLFVGFCGAAVFRRPASQSSSTTTLPPLLRCFHAHPAHSPREYRRRSAPCRRCRLSRIGRRLRVLCVASAASSSRTSTPKAACATSASRFAASVAWRTWASPRKGHAATSPCGSARRGGQRSPWPRRRKSPMRPQRRVDGSTRAAAAAVVYSWACETADTGHHGPAACRRRGVGDRRGWGMACGLYKLYS